MTSAKKIHINQKMWFIGFRIGYTSDDHALSSFDRASVDIERTLIDAAYEARSDFRILSVLMSWIKVHGEYVIVEKFFKFAKHEQDKRGHNPVINGIAVWGTLCKQTKWARYVSRSPEDEYLVDPELTDLSAEFRGYKQDWLRLGVKVPLKMIRIREDDVFSPKELVQGNLQFRNRLIIGSAWRSDIVTAIEYGLENPTVISKTLGCSYEPALRIFKEYRLAKASN
ncbi:MAG: hypothetical protein HYW49_11695 [Deltaproteobacteria bacterium]|nr:hypothetical protein [Deltaproteobacteria bacterium]